MRYLDKFTDPYQAEKFSKHLSGKGIHNRLEKIVNTDWGSSDYGIPTAAVWIIDEDQVEEAQSLLEKFKENPADSTFEETHPHTHLTPSIPSNTTTMSPPAESPTPPKTKEARKNVKVERNRLGPITLYLLILCTILFLFIQSQTPSLTKITEGLPYTPVLSSPLRKDLLFDYPKAYSYIDKIVALYGPSKFDTVEQLPPEGQMLFKQFLDTPVWQGIYFYVLDYFNPPKNPAPVGNLIEKIREGEWWRTITPCVMHADIFHLIFNMLWLLVLGKQMEFRLGKFRYIFFMVIVGIVSNFVQYFMSGPNFIGYSGILCGMLAFIWMRQKVAAWEGYQMQQGTFSFMLFFVLAILAVQVISFTLEAANIAKLSVNIANAAHLSGGITGALLGKLSYFEWKSKGK